MQNMYLYTFLTVILMFDQLKASTVLEVVQGISNGTNETWEKVGNQIIANPERQEPKPLKEILQQDLSVINQIVTNMYIKVKHSIMCRSLRYLMPIAKLSSYILITVMSNREETEKIIRETVLNDLKNTPTIINDLDDIPAKYIPTDDLAIEFGELFKEEIENSDEASEHAVTVGTRALECAQEGFKETASKIKFKLFAAKVAREKIKELDATIKFNKEMLDIKFERKTAEEKEAYKNQFKKQGVVVSEVINDDGELDIDSMLDSYIETSEQESENEDQASKVIDRIAGKTAMKNRKKINRDYVILATDNLKQAMNNIESWISDVEPFNMFIKELKEKLTINSKSKVIMLDVLKSEYDSMFNFYSNECNSNTDFTKIYEDLDQDLVSVINAEGEYSINELIGHISVLNYELKQDLDSLPTEWKNSENFKA